MRKIQIIGGDTRMAAVLMSGAMVAGMILCAHFFDGQAFQTAAEILLLLITIIGSVYIVTLFLSWPASGGNGKEEKCMEREKDFSERRTRNAERRMEVLYRRSLQQDTPFSTVEAMIDPGFRGMTIGKIQESKNALLKRLGSTWHSFSRNPALISEPQRTGGQDVCNTCDRITPDAEDSGQEETIRGYDIEEVIYSLNPKAYRGGKMAASFISSPAEYDFRSNMITCGRYMMYDQNTDNGTFVPLVQLRQGTGPDRSFHIANYETKQDKKIVEMYRDGANVSRIAGTVFKNTNGRNTKKVRTVLERYGVV